MPGKSTKPLLKMTKISVSNNLARSLEKRAKEGGEPSECFVCGLVQDMIDGLKGTLKD